MRYLLKPFIIVNAAQLKNTPEMEFNMKKENRNVYIWIDLNWNACYNERELTFWSEIILANVHIIHVFEQY